MLICTKLGIKVAIVAPGINQPSVDQELNQMAEATGLVTRTLDLKEALEGTDYVHTDTWMDMEFFEDGKVLEEFKTQYEERINKFKPYQLNANLINTYCPDAKIMHCMPCHIVFEITRDAVDHPNSVIFDQAENRLHGQNAIILKLLGKL
jgi:ornithine carbamoyltransferase